MRGLAEMYRCSRTLHQGQAVILAINTGPPTSCSSSPPELFEPFSALTSSPASCKVYKQIPVTIPHFIPTLYICVELALRIYRNVISYQLVLENQMLQRVLFGIEVFVAHQQVVCHGLKQESRESRPSEEGAACVDALVVLRDEDIDILCLNAFWCVDVSRTNLDLPVKYRSVPHGATSDSIWRDNLRDQVVLRVHEDDIGVE